MATKTIAAGPGIQLSEDGTDLIIAAAPESITVSSNDGPTTVADLRGRSTGTTWGRIDVNGFTNIRYSQEFVVGETYEFEDLNGDLFAFELASIDHGTPTESFIELYPASEPTKNGALGNPTANHLGTDFVDVEDAWDGSGRIRKLS